MCSSLHKVRNGLNSSIAISPVRTLPVSSAKLRGTHKNGCNTSPKSGGIS